MKIKAFNTIFPLFSSFVYNKKTDIQNQAFKKIENL